MSGSLFFLGQADGSKVVNLIEILFTNLSRPSGFLPFIAVLITFFYTIGSKRGPLLAVSIVFFTLCFGYLDSNFFDNTLIGPLQALRDSSRPLTVIFLFSLCLSAPRTDRGWRMSFVLFATLAFYVFQSMYLLRLLLAGESVRSILGILTDGLLFVGIVYGLGRRIQSQLDVDSILRALSIASALFLACNIMQLGFGYGQAIGQGRFMGVSGNPQLAGFVCAVFVIVNCYSHSRSSLKSWMSYYHAIQIGLLLMLIVWSGSRMSALSVAVGLIFFYRLRIGKILVFGIVSGIVLFIAVSLFPDSLTKVDRFTSGLDTRSAVWAARIDDFKSNPLFGTIGAQNDQEVNASESSYLSTAALMGVTGLLLLALTVFSMVTSAIKCWIHRRCTNFSAESADIVIAGIAMILLASIFEGFFLGILSMAVVFLYLLLTIAAYLLDAASQPENEAEPSDPEDESVETIEAFVQ
jgi:Na+-transporting methylmalonyl-CoA/oxaloacetate decarboxylase gamma subunit